MSHILERGAAVAARAVIAALSEETSDTTEERSHKTPNDETDFAPPGQQLLTFTRQKGTARASSATVKRSESDVEENDLPDVIESNDTSNGSFPFHKVRLIFMSIFLLANGPN